MAKNVDLWETLHNLEWSSFSETDRSNFVKACDALLAVDFNDPVEFRKVATEHAAILGLLDEDAARKWATPSRLNPFTYDPKDYYTNSAFLDENDEITFRSIQQEAAAQRVKLGLSEVTNQNVLLGVLQNNQEALREYIAEHIAPKIADAADWDPTAPSEDNLLSDEILEDIQKDAVAHWVLLAVEGVELDVLEELIENVGDDFYERIKALPDFPKEHADLIDNDRIWALVEERVLARQKELLVEAAFEDYTEYFENGTNDPAVLSMGPLLIADDANFRAGLPDAGSEHNDHKGDLSADQVKALREQLGERYLKLDVARRVQNGESLDQLFMADTEEAFSRELKKLYPAHAYIDQVVTPKFINECKKQVAPTMGLNIAKEIREQEGDYKLLMDVASQSDEKFKKALKARKTTDSALGALFPGVDLTDEAAKNQAVQQVSNMVDALFTPENRVQMDEIRQAARTRAFEIAVSAAARLAPGSHKSLVEAFSNMSVEAQEKLLPRTDKDMERVVIIKHLVNARDISVLEHYMPDADADDLQAILDSSVQHDLSKQIQNPGIYKVLAARFPVDLTQEQVDEINATLAGKDWNADASYIQMVAEIKDICGIAGANEAAFNRAFGLADDGLTKNDPHGFATEIHNHNKKYKELFDEYQDPGSTINKNFLGAMLALPLSYGTLPNTPAAFKALQNQVLNFADRELFINVCVGTGSTGLSESQRNQFKASLERAISPALFNQMQAELVYEACAEQKPDDATKAVNKVQKMLDQMQQSQEKIGKHLDSAKFVFKVKEIHINNLLIREQEKAPKPGESLREKYGALAKNCDAKMDELRHDHARLQSLIDALPATADIGDRDTKAKVGPKIEELKGKLQAQQVQIDQQLERYAQIKEHIEGPDGILDMVQRVKQQPYWYYNRAEITSGVATREELSALAIQDGSHQDDGLLRIEQNDPGAVAKFNLAKAPLNSSQVHYFDIVQKRQHTSDASQTVTIESRFTYDTSKSVPTTGTDRGIHRANAGRITVDKFPTYQEGSPTDPVLLEQAKVDYAMVVATQLLATMDRPPSKDNPLRLRGTNKEQLEYIWTALVVLGEKTPNMKFGPDAIRVVNDHIFNPKSQLGWGWSNFSKDSVYEQVFKKHSDSVTSAIDASKEQASERLNRKGTPKSEEQMKATSQQYRSTVNTNRDERVNAHGVSAETEAEQARRGPH
ncbi:MAG: hypothetical protein P4L79_14350 [Legionella sp.]|uniref:hypothetical protein n=1 Tax=Legionella sp. TaxID=459 RepID=UPI0028400FD1|nr:hypothetical protein [Legionella sp.]